MSDPIDELTALRGAFPSQAVQERSLAALRKTISADAVLLVSTGSTITILAAATPSIEISENLVRTAAPIIAAAPHDKTISKKFTFREQGVQMVAVPCGTASVWLMAWIRAEGTGLETSTQIIRLAAASIPVETAGSPEIASAAVALLSSFSQPRKVRLETFAQKISLLLGCHSVFIAHRTLRGWSVPACFPAPVPATRSSLHETLLLALASHGNESTPATYPPDVSHPALAEITRTTETASCAVIPAGESWALIATWRTAAPTPEDLQQAVAPLAPLLPSLDRHARSFLDQWRSLPFQRKRIWVTIAAGLAILLLFPFHMRVHAPVILEPSLRRFIAAPFDSVLKKVHVQAGDLVEAGSLLAELDGKEVRERIAEIEAQAASANLQSASDLAGSRFDDSALSSLQAQRAGHELEVLRQRDTDLRILSPIAGVVIQGDLDREEGAALKLGRSIMEIAPLNTMIVEVALREEDAAYIHIGQKIIVRLNSLPSSDVHANITKINPRAETRDGRNVFVAEAEIQNPRGEFRPGMKGEAIVVADRRPLFWILFRKPWNTLRSWLFW